MIMQIYSNKYCENSYYEKIINDFSFAKYLEEEGTKNVCNAMKPMDKKQQGC